uniref:TNFR-Cys domain-containing protein n=1 Tax=Chromera velia CCMP2878 TaxID=1169474 RepID=A0A0G4FBM0_9ALVE|eukprot:Cvel_16057.t1-p1 / transcript=Cvel_16057.t1 / gene=Cvel_16057 / organism=Chromera_velia_CCMP2878 / gene_product=hypothetical protein / transcript_product=hypothetical protein / location=Cvel_scaffold1220:32317-33895(-) / protein_length=333 / sequence_SO=supercontig / SO=protein_coding / is_pseudo=false
MVRVAFRGFVLVSLCTVLKCSCQEVFVPLRDAGDFDGPSTLSLDTPLESTIQAEELDSVEKQNFGRVNGNWIDMRGGGNRGMCCNLCSSQPIQSQQFCFQSCNMAACGGGGGGAPMPARPPSSSVSPRRGGGRPAGPPSGGSGGSGGPRCVQDSTFCCYECRVCGIASRSDRGSAQSAARSQCTSAGGQNCRHISTSNSCRAPSTGCKHTAVSCCFRCNVCARADGNTRSEAESSARSSCRASGGQQCEISVSEQVCPSSSRRLEQFLTQSPSDRALAAVSEDPWGQWESSGGAAGGCPETQMGEGRLLTESVPEPSCARRESFQAEERFGGE